MQGDTAHAHLIHGNSTLCLSMCWFGGKIKKERERKGSRDEDKETKNKLMVFRNGGVGEHGE